MAGVEIDLLAISRGLVIAPAGCGKTQLIADALGRHAGDKPILVLTHTNAGVASLRGRLDRAGVRPGSYRLATIDGWAIRLISTFPERAGHNPSIITRARPSYPAIREAAFGLIKAGHIDDILAASYDRLFVDEYQDCSIRQHYVVGWAAKTLPTVVLGDNLQSIFGFGDDRLALWQDEVLKFFPLVGELSTPWRWINAGSDALGEWLLALRAELIAGRPIDLRTAPAGVEWVPLDGTHDGAIRLQAGAVDAPGDTKVLIIGDSTDPRGQRRFASQIPGAVTVEAVNLQDLTDFGGNLDLNSANALRTVANFAESLMSAFSADELVNNVRGLRDGAVVRAPTDIETQAMLFEKERSCERAGELLAAINRAGGVRCYRPNVLYAAQRALQLCASAGGPSFGEATVTIREQTRLIGRPLAKRSVGSTLLLKGLEAEISVTLNADGLDAKNLYVAMTRGSKRLLVCSRSPILNPGA
jgi:DNA helicase-2/ATP-dependent DNA helicase PcrA